MLAVAGSVEVSGLIALGFSLVLTPAALLLLRRWHILDHPNARSSHDRPVVRGGGLAVAAACLAAWSLASGDAGMTAAGLGTVVSASAFGAIGLADDLKGLSALARFPLQAGASALACTWLLRDLEGLLLWQVIFAGGAFIWLVAHVNGFNFMDGINGISGVQAFLVGSAWAWLGHSQAVDELVWGGLILAGAALGFLPFNFPRAKVFPGDVGSYFIGGWQAAMLVVGFRAGVPPEAMLAPLLIYLADTSFTLARRVLSGNRWHEPHREHIYQRLVRQGWSHSRTTAVVGAGVGLCCSIAVLAASSESLRVVAGIGLAVVMAVYLALPAWLERHGRRAAEVT